MEFINNIQFSILEGDNMLDIIAIFLVFMALGRLSGDDWYVGLLFILVAIILEIVERKILK